MGEAKAFRRGWSLVEEPAQLSPLGKLSGDCHAELPVCSPSSLCLGHMWVWALGCPSPQEGNRGHQRALCLSPSMWAVSSTKGVLRPPIRSGPVPLTTERENTQQNSVGNKIYWKLLSHIQYWFGGYIRRRLHNMRQVEGLGGGCVGTCVRCALCWAGCLSRVESGCVCMCACV